MSLIRHSLFPRSMLDMDEWTRTPLNMLSSTLEQFDPFDELDRQLGRNLTWINKPFNVETVWPKLPVVPNKYRITVDCNGYSPESIKTELKDNNRKVVVSGKEELKTSKDNYSNKEFRKTYNLPEKCEADKMVSFMTPGDRLVIEFPLRKEETTGQKNLEIFPTIKDNPDGTKSVSMKFDIPSGIDPSHCNVTIKDRDLIVRCEEKQEKEDSVSRFHYYHRTTFPENTNFDQLKCVSEGNQICVTAPISKGERKSRVVPIENLQSTQALK